jgi:hypothetical protein
MSAQTIPRQAFYRLPGGKDEVFVEEVSEHTTQHSFWASRTASADTIDTVPFDAVRAEMYFSKQGKHRKRCKVLHRSRQPTPPCQEEPTSFPEYVAQ